MFVADMPWPAIAALSKDTPVLIPVAAMEQHGHHLPIATDSLLLGEVVRRAEERLRNQVLVAPLLWLGNSHHHLDFAGTVSAQPRVYLDVLSNLAECFLHHGFRRIVFVNGHGGNIVPGSQAVFELRQRYRARKDLLLLFSTYWLLAGQPGTARAGLNQQGMGHACEWETSMILRIAPHLVHDHARQTPAPMQFSFAPATRGWVTQDRSSDGHIGDPRSATAEKGEALLAEFSADLLRLLEQTIHWNGETWGEPLVSGSRPRATG